MSNQEKTDAIFRYIDDVAGVIEYPGHYSLKRIIEISMEKRPWYLIACQVIAFVTAFSCFGFAIYTQTLTSQFIGLACTGLAFHTEWDNVKRRRRQRIYLDGVYNQVIKRLHAEEGEHVVNFMSFVEFLINEQSPYITPRS